MSIPFSADEVFEMAEQIERNGAAFYKKAAEMAKRAETRDLLANLAKMEEGHISIFTQLRKQLPKEAIESATFDPYGEMGMYLKAAADTHVFNMHKDVSATLSGKETVEEVLNRAIQFEKDSIVFFIGIRESVPEGMGKNQIETLIKQELGHVSELVQQLMEIK